MRNVFILLSLLFMVDMSAQTVIDIDGVIEVKSFKLSDIFCEKAQSCNIKVPVVDNGKSICTFELILGDKIAVNLFMNSLLIYNDKGNLLKEIKNTGLLRTWNILWPHQEKGEIYESSFFKDSTTRKVINCLTEKKIEEIQIPRQYASNISTLIECGGNIYGAYTNNKTGIDSTLFVFFNKKGTILKTIDNHRTYVNYTADNQETASFFYAYDDRLFFQEQEVGNTVFEIKDLNLKPHIIFNFGNKAYNYEWREMPDGNKGRAILGPVCETQSRIYFSITLDNKIKWGYYNKQDKKVYLTSFEKEKGRSESNFIIGYQQACPKAIVNVGYDNGKYKLLIGTLR